MRISRQATVLVALTLLGGACEPSEGVAGASPQSPPLIQGAPAQPLPLDQVRFLAALRSKVPVAPPPLEGDPYAPGHARPAPAPSGAVCGVRFESDQIHYRLSTFPEAMAERAAGFAVTHFGACGTCSTLQDLAVYVEKPDLTTPVRRCGVSSHAAAALRCLEALGFSRACAQTWLYNARNTRRQCFGVCVWSWLRDAPPTEKDGGLNACLQCDEDRSGPIFKATAGRTRRNSGLRSSIPRPEDEVAPVIHDYLPDLEAE